MRCREAATQMPCGHAKSWQLLPVLAGLTSAKPCQDPLDWSPGKHVPYDSAAQQRSISHIGDVRRFRPLLEKLSTPNSTVKVLVIAASDVTGNQTTLWSDVFAEWLRRTFNTRIQTSSFFLTGVLAEHLQVIVDVGRIQPDLVIVEISLSALVQRTEYSSMDQTPQYLVEETFMRALLQLPANPALLWVELMPPQSFKYPTNQETDSLLTEYYNVPQVSVRGAWHHQLPFNAEELWDGSQLSLLGHKLIAVTLSNFMCYELAQTCQTDERANVVLPKALFSTSPEQLEDLNGHGHVKRAMPDPSDSEKGRLDVHFCRSGGDVLAPEKGTPNERLAWSLAATLAVLPLGVLHVCASFVAKGGEFLQNDLPQSMPELEFLRVVSTVNIVAWQYYQDFPPAWSQPGSSVVAACHDPYYDYPNWTRVKAAVCGKRQQCVWCRSGKYCFQFFFLLQAFVSTLNTVRTGAQNPVWQYAQVWPLHAVGLALALAAHAPLNPLDLALAGSLAHAWVTPFHSALNGASWYLSALVAFWIVLPIWIRAADWLAAVRGVCGVVTALVLVWLCTLAFPILAFVWPVNFGLREVDPRMVIHNYVEYSPYANWQPVLIGMLMAVLVMLGIEPRTKTAVMSCLVVAVVGLSVVWFVVPSPGFSMGSEYLLLDKGFGILPLFASLLLGSVGARNTPNPIHRVFTGKAMRGFAQLCWPIFILHQPVHRLCIKVIFPYLSSRRLPYYVYMLLYPSALVLISALGSRLIDRPWTVLLFRFKSASVRETPAYGGRGNTALYEHIDARSSRR